MTFLVGILLSVGIELCAAWLTVKDSFMVFTVVVCVVIIFGRLALWIRDHNKFIYALFAVFGLLSVLIVFGPHSSQRDDFDKQFLERSATIAVAVIGISELINALRK